MPRALAVGGGVLLANLLLISLFYKELKLSTFDAGLAATLGFLPGLLHYGLMTMVSVTAIASFDAVGAILVVALMIAPAAAAYLLTERLSTMLGLSVLIGAISAVGGYWLARWMDTTISGAMASMTGVIFGLTWLAAPERGLIALALRQTRQRWEFAQQMLAVHLLHHEGTAAAAEESRVDNLDQHLRWQPSFASAVVQRAEKRGLVRREGNMLLLTEQGRQVAQEAF